jgi:uncharacterized protein YjiS (DUF1127 family)
MLKNSLSKFENRIHRLRNRRFGGDVRHGRQVVGEEPMRASQHSLPNREREIRRAVDALAKLDDGTLRDIGIPDRSQIELVVRYWHDC